MSTKHKVIVVGAWCLVALATGVFAPSAYADARAGAKSQVAFGIVAAQHGLWREALHRWKQAVELDPSYAAAWNDLALAYEQAGQYGEAGDAFEKALELEPDNRHIRLNYDLFGELRDRQTRRPR